MKEITKYYDKNITVNITYTNTPSKEAILEYAKKLKKIMNHIDTKVNAG